MQDRPWARLRRSRPETVDRVIAELLRNWWPEVPTDVRVSPSRARVAPIYRRGVGGWG
jgi:hypothetical protein